VESCIYQLRGGGFVDHESQVPLHPAYGHREVKLESYLPLQSVLARDF